MRNLSPCFLVLAISPLLHAEGVIETMLVTAPEAARNMQMQANIARVETAAQMPGLRIDSAEILQSLPGVQADSRSNYAQDTRITLRGFGARSAFGVRGVDITLDGIPLSTPDGQGQVSSVMLGEIAAVDLLRGPIAGLHGNGAGGVIALQTQAPQENRVAVNMAAGDAHLRRQVIEAEWRDGPQSYSQGGSKNPSSDVAPDSSVAGRFQASRLSTDGDRPHASAEREHVGAQLYFTRSSGIETVLRFDASRDPLLQDPLGLTEAQWREDPRQLNPTAELFNTRKEVAHQQVSLTARQAEGNGRWQAAVWGGSREISQHLGFSGDSLTGSGGVVDLERDFFGVKANYSHDFNLFDAPAIASFGAEIAQMEDHRRGYVNNFGEAGDLRRDEVGQAGSRDIYHLLEWQLTQAWKVFGGARYSNLNFDVEDNFVVEINSVTLNPDDSGEKDFSEWSSAFGASFSPTENWTFYGSAGRGFETPTLTETAYRNDASGLNTSLGAANNRQQEVGFTFRGSEEKTINLSVFSIDSSDEIVVDQSNGGRTTYRNAAATERRGIELTGYVHLLASLSLRLTANYLDAQYRGGEEEGNQLPGVARQHHYLQLRWQPWLDERITMSLLLQDRDRVATADDNQIFAPPSTTADIAIISRLPLGEWDMSAWIKLANITDENYIGSVIVNQSNGRAFEPAPERNVSGGLELAYRF